MALKTTKQGAGLDCLLASIKDLGEVGGVEGEGEVKEVIAGAEWEMQAEAVHEVAEKFVVANCYNPQVACQQFHQCQVSETGKGDSSAVEEVLINCDKSL